MSDTISDEERRTLFEWGENIFGVADNLLRWRPKDTHLFVERDGRVLGHVGLLKHTVRVGGEAVEVGGVGGVVTVPEEQGRGHAQMGMRRAAEFMRDEMGVEFGLLFCRDQLVPFYQRLGWRLVRDPVEIEQDSGPVISPLHVMVLPCAGRDWPAGKVELDSLPW